MLPCALRRAAASSCAQNMLQLIDRIHQDVRCLMHHVLLVSINNELSLFPRFTTWEPGRQRDDYSACETHSVSLVRRTATTPESETEKDQIIRCQTTRSTRAQGLRAARAAPRLKLERERPVIPLDDATQRSEVQDLARLLTTVIDLLEAFKLLALTLNWSAG